MELPVPKVCSWTWKKLLGLRSAAMQFVNQDTGRWGSWEGLRLEILGRGFNASVRRLLNWRIEVGTWRQEVSWAIERLEAIQVGHRVSIAVPLEYNDGFIGRAFLMDYTNQVEPSFRVALSAENKGRYSCSLEVFLGDVKGPKDRVGWFTGTSRQGVERLQILRTGNLVLVDILNLIKGQSFNFPTDVMLWGQRLDVSTWLTSFPRNSTWFYTFEIGYDRVALYLNSGKSKYSYWEFKPSKNRNITFVELGSKGLELFNDNHKKNGAYRFVEASFQALNSTCDLPLACKPYGICTLSNACSCIPLLTREKDMVFDCNNEGISGHFFGRTQSEMTPFNSSMCKPVLE
ncbi:putative DNA binding protein [Hibiscus syriacus]|uniref:DNA binding protein n=1 Tax=Hibiscus syriacus TaxID=106335 RepID=A0A6A2XMG4_HIBSY|nr:putative DNA binding protein [Hibiscus syriacus]